MRIRLQQSDAARLELELPHADGRPRTVCLTDLRGASGAIERVVAGATGRELWARGVRAASAVVDHLEWPLPGGGRVAATSPGAVAGLTLELHARETARAADDAPVSGRAALTRAGARAIAIELGGGQRLAVDVDASAAALELSPERIGYASMERLELGNLQTALGAWLVRVSAAALDRLRADWRDGELLVGAGGGRLGASTLTAEGVTVDIEGGQLAEGMRTSGRALVIPEVVLPEVRIAVDDLVDLVRRHLPAEPPPVRRAATDGGRFRFDFGFLDRITGRLDVDLTMELSVPVIGKREATHHFRIPIVSGALNYRELERDLAGVEDAFIDLEVRGRSLVLERRIPLLGLEKPLVVWELTQEELELAKKRLVLLRTVPRMQLVRSGGGGDGKGPIAVRRLRFGAVEIELALAPSDEEEPDAIGSVSIANLKAGGELVYEIPGAARRSGLMAAVPAAGAPADPTREPITSGADLVIERLAGGPFALPAGRARLEVDRIEVDAVEGQVEFAGLRPRGARLVARGVLLRNLKIALPALVALAVACGGGGDGGGPPAARADARPVDAGPPGDARLGVDCRGARCAQEERCCADQVEPPYYVYVCVPDGVEEGCQGGIFDCDGPEDCASRLCCGGLRIECAPEGATSCPDGAPVCHTDDDCGGGPCCPTPTGVVRECAGPC